MKSVSLIALIAFLSLFTFHSLHAGEEISDVSGAEWLSSKGIQKVGELSLADIKEFRTSWDNPGKDSTIEFQASFEAWLKDKKDKDAYLASGKIPFRIVANLEQVIVKSGKTRKKREKGLAFLYIFDSNGKVVSEDKVSLTKMCNS